MRKLFIVLLSIFIVIVLLVTSFIYFNPNIDSEWRVCTTDQECVLVEHYSYCNCGYPFSVNQEFEDEYNSFRSRINIGQFMSLSRFTIICDMCAFDPTAEYITRCINNGCTAMVSCGKEHTTLGRYQRIPCCEGLVETSVTRPNGELVEEVFTCEKP